MSEADVTALLGKPDTAAPYRGQPERVSWKYRRSVLPPGQGMGVAEVASGSSEFGGARVTGAHSPTRYVEIVEIEFLSGVVASVDIDRHMHMLETEGPFRR